MSAKVVDNNEQTVASDNNLSTSPDSTFPDSSSSTTVENNVQIDDHADDSARLHASSPDSSSPTVNNNVQTDDDDAVKENLSTPIFNNNVKTIATDDAVDDADNAQVHASPDSSSPTENNNEQTVADDDAVTAKSSVELLLGTDSETGDIATPVVLSRAPQAEEVVDKQPANIIEHSEYADSVAAAAPVRFPVRRTIPKIYKHRCVCLTQMRVYDAIDDNGRIAQVGTQWQLDNRAVTVLLCASLGYAQEKEDRRRQRKTSAKFDDLRPVSLVVRDVSLNDKPISFKDLRRVTAQKMFREGIPFAHVDTELVHRLRGEVQQFVDFNELHDNSESWLRIQPLVPAVVKSPSPSSKPVQTTPIAGTHAANCAKNRRKRKQTKKLEDAAKRRREREEKAEEKRLRDKEQQRQRRYAEKLWNKWMSDYDYESQIEKLAGTCATLKKKVESRKGVVNKEIQAMKRNRFDKTFEKQVMALVKKALSPIKGTQKKIMMQLITDKDSGKKKNTPMPSAPPNTIYHYPHHAQFTFPLPQPPAPSPHHPYTHQLPAHTHQPLQLPTQQLQPQLQPPHQPQPQQERRHLPQPQHQRQHQPQRQRGYLHQQEGYLPDDDHNEVQWTYAEDENISGNGYATRSKRNRSARRRVVFM